MKWLNILQKLDDKKCYIFSVREFFAILGGTKLAAKRLLQSYSKKGLVARIKKGMYLIISKKPPDIFIANKLYSPSYITLEYALAYYHIIPETVYQLTSASVKTTREFEVLGQSYAYSKIKSAAFTGYMPKKIGDYTVLIAEPEKALADYLYFCGIRKTAPSERIDLKRINKGKFIKYVKLFNNKRLTKTAGELLCSQKKT